MRIDSEQLNVLGTRAGSEWGLAGGMDGVREGDTVDWSLQGK